MKCDKCGKDWSTLTFPNCKNPAVITYFGNYICPSCCTKCKYGKNMRCEYIEVLKYNMPKKPKNIKETENEPDQIELNAYY